MRRESKIDIMHIIILNVQVGDKRTNSLLEFLEKHGWEYVTQTVLQQCSVMQADQAEPSCSCSKGKGLDWDDDGRIYCIDCGLNVQEQNGA